MLTTIYEVLQILFFDNITLRTVVGCNSYQATEQGKENMKIWSSTWMGWTTLWRVQMSQGRPIFSIVANIRLPYVDPLNFQFRWTQSAFDSTSLRPHIPMRYALHALDIDPSCRLAISLQGRNFHVWLQNEGELVAKRMNVLVDTLEGFTFEESRTFRRRFYVSREDGWFRHYTQQVR